MAFRGGEAWFVIDTVCCVVTASRHGYYHLITINHKSYACLHPITLRLLNDNDSEVAIANSSPLSTGIRFTDGVEIPIP